MPYFLEKTREYLAHAPIKDERVFVDELLAMPDRDLMNFVEENVALRRMDGSIKLSMDKISALIEKEGVKTILDFGCGLGLDGTFYAREYGVSVTFADIVYSTFLLTSRYGKILNIPTKAIHIDTEPESFEFPETYDMILSLGVLDHTPKAKLIVTNLKKYVRNDGIFVCMLYTEKYFDDTKAKTLREYDRRSDAAPLVQTPFSDHYGRKRAKEVFQGFELIDSWLTSQGRFGWYVFRPMKFSVVIPVKDELRHIGQNLSSWCMLKPDELILCSDKITELDATTTSLRMDCVETAKEICERHGVSLRILEVEPNSEYVFHQAWVRRKGFLEASNDAILTGDIDLKVLPSCLKAVELVGKNDVGLVSLLKERHAPKFYGRIRTFMDQVVRPIIFQVYSTLNKKNDKPSYFTGLYAFYRPYWLETEDSESLKQLEDPKVAKHLHGSWGGYIGEDTHLKNWMESRYKCIFLPDIGALDYGVGLEETTPIQLKIGREYVLMIQRPMQPLKDSLFNVRPHVLGSYIHHLSYGFGNPLSSVFLVASDIILCLAYLLARIGLLVLYDKPNRNRVLEEAQIRKKLLSETKRRQGKCNLEKPFVI